MTITANTLFYALTGGILPAIAWLMFWLQEDKKRPEPRGLLIATFLGGMLAVILVIPLQKLTRDPSSQFNTFLWWAALEEIFKFSAAYFIAFRRKEMNEPIDALIYLMTAAFGFVALENTFFILESLTRGQILESIITGNLRFVGASLLHTISSAALGFSIAVTFYKSSLAKHFALFAGLLIAIALHTTYNLLIIKGTNSVTFATFGFVWVGIVILMALFERVKNIFPVNKI